MEQTNASEEIKKRFDEYFKGNIDENSYLHINTVYVRNFIQSEIDLAVSKERERVVEMLEEVKPDLSEYKGTEMRFWQGIRKGIEQAVKLIKNN